MPRLQDYVDDDSDYGSDEDGIVYVTDTIRAEEEEDEDVEFVCTLCTNNRKSFKSHAALVEHKIRVRHDYCQLCDEDFPDWEAQQLHILSSNKHITCFMCNKEFKSESGLQLHMNQTHRTSTGGMCPKCLESFSTQSGLLQHIEGNLCPGGLKRTDIHKAIIMNQKLQNEMINEEMQDSTVETDAQEDRSELAKSFEHFKILDQKDNSLGEDGGKIEAQTEWYNDRLRAWVCPFNFCRKKFRVLLSFEQHLNSGTHTSKIFSCPGCKNKFTSSSAMLQHVESGMCRIMKMKDYKLVKQGLTASIDQEELMRSISSSQRGNTSGYATPSTSSIN